MFSSPLMVRRNLEGIPRGMPPLGGGKTMACFQDPQKRFSPVEVVERLLILYHCGDTPPSLYLASDFDLALYLDGLGFDAYSRERLVGQHRAIDFNRFSMNVLPSGDRGHSHLTAH
ncbi:hypothetical protein J8C01_02430 [Chloracidobacterium sp. D]|nr:hypothetical protein [Chloracidobacterium sp. D]QUV82205.1 hypothetical protein J8C01_02430 [Chloracidobacterium sp. D]